MRVKRTSENEVGQNPLSEELQQETQNGQWLQCQHCKYTTSVDIQKRARKS